MNITEEAVRKRQTLVVDDPETAYPEIRDLLERRMSFDSVEEEKYYNDIEEGNIRSKIVTAEWFDDYTKEQLEIFLVISKHSREVDIQIKGKLVTNYPDDYGYQQTVWYYAYRSLFDKFLYGEVRHEWEHAVEEKVEELLHRVRENVEENH